MCDYNKRTWWDWLLLSIAAAIGIPALVVLFWPGGFDVIQMMREHRVKEQMELIKKHEPTTQPPTLNT